MDYDFIHDKEKMQARLVGQAPEKPVLVKKFSRNIFLIRTDKRTEEMEHDPSEHDDDEIEDSSAIMDNMEPGIEEEEEAAAAEEEVDEEEVEGDEDQDITMNGDIGDEDEEDEDDEDSDHDTDIVEEEEEEVNPLTALTDHPPPRLGSKQKSLAKAPTTQSGKLLKNCPARSMHCLDVHRH
jgi:hypothetical protein